MKHKKIRNCEICGKEFTIKSGSQIYCSDECYEISREKKSQKEQKNKRNKTKKFFPLMMS